MVAAAAQKGRDGSERVPGFCFQSLRDRGGAGTVHSPQSRLRSGDGQPTSGAQRDGPGLPLSSLEGPGFGATLDGIQAAWHRLCQGAAATASLSRGRGATLLQLYVLRLGGDGLHPGEADVSLDLLKCMNVLCLIIVSSQQSNMR